MNHVLCTTVGCVRIVAVWVVLGNRVLMLREGVRRVAGVVGVGAALPHPGVGDDAPRASVVHAVRHHVPLRRR